MILFSYKDEDIGRFQICFSVPLILTDYFSVLFSMWTAGNMYADEQLLLDKKEKKNVMS